MKSLFNTYPRFKTFVLSLVFLLVFLTFLTAFLIPLGQASENAVEVQTFEPVSNEIAEIEVLMYKIFRSPNGYAALVGGALNEEIPLPAIFEVAVPAGVEILWFGEISGGPRADDRQFTGTYEKRTENGFDIYTTVTSEHVIQIEYLIDGEPFEALGNGEHVFYLNYTPLHNARVLRLAAYLPKDSTVTDPSFQQFGFAPQSDEPLYGITFTDVNGGQTYEAELRYGPPASIARQGSANLTGGILATIGIIAVATIVAIWVFTASRHRCKTAEDYDEYEYDEDEVENEYYHNEDEEEE